VIIAVIVVMMMQTAFVQIVHMVAVRHRLMVTMLGGLRAMHVSCMLGAAVIRRASIGVLLGDLDPMFLDGIALWMLEVTLSQVVDVASVTNGRVAASGSVSMCHS
jgi:hypothetical protein